MLLRRVAGAVGAAALLAVTLPALPAFAVPSVATLVTGVDVLPGARTYEIDIRNTDSALIGGSPINAVLFTLPSAAGVRAAAPATVAEKAPTGWTVKVTDSGSLQTYQYTANSGGISRNGTLRFVLPTTVVAPVDTDRSGDFRVSTSTTKGTGAADPATGNLKTTIRILELLKSAASSPAGVVDQTATAGQSITVTSTVKNYAQRAVTVTPALAGGGGDTVKAPAPTSALVGGNGGVATFAFPVDLASGGDRTASFTTTATATGATALAQANDIGVQAPATLTLDGTSFGPKALKTTGLTKAPVFTLKGTVGGTAKLEQLAGSIAFNGNTVPATSAPKTGANQDYTFSGPTTFTGADGEYVVTPSFTGKDDNGFDYLAPFATVGGGPIKLVIDNLGVKITSTLTTASGIDAVKDGQALNLKVELDDPSATLGTTVLRLDKGDGTKPAEIDVRPNLSSSDGGKTYTGTYTPSGLGTAVEELRLAATADDRATNGFTGGLSNPVRVDNIAPDLYYAQTLEPVAGATDTRILVRLRDFDNKGDKLTATQKESATSRPVVGGCTPSQWSVNGELLVKAVTYSDGTACRAGTRPPGNELVLVLNGTKDQDYASNVTYNQGRLLSDPVRDEVVNNLVTDTVTTVIGIAPAPPTVVLLQRGTQGQVPARETATGDEGKYFTRFAGDDLVLTFAGGRAGYQVQVLDGPDDADDDGKTDDVLRTEDIGDAAEDNTIVVPLGTLGTGEVVREVSRKVRLLNVGRLASKTLDLTVVYDTTPLAIATSVPAGNTVEVTLNDKVWSGTNNAFDWFAFRTVDGGRDYYPAGSVAISQDGKGRTLTLQETPPAVNGSFYFLQSEGGERYLDRAGNPLANSAGSF